MKKWILIGTVSALGGLLGSGVIGGRFLTAGAAQEAQSLSEETRMFLSQYEILKTQSLTLIDTVTSLKQDRRRLMEDEEALKKENRELAPKVKELLEALEQTRQALGVLRQQHAAALARVEELEQAQMKALTQEMQNLQRPLENLKEEDLKKTPSP